MGKKREGIKRSIDRWEEIKIKLQEEYIPAPHERRKWWKNTYWTDCGYCDYYGSCPDCALNRYSGEILVCDGDTDNKFSYAYNALAWADEGSYDSALEYCEIVLINMKKDYREEIHSIEMPHEKRKAIKRAMNKWKKIKSELQKKHEKEQGWEAAYWAPCGYCDYYVACADCALNRYVNNTLLCDGESDNDDNLSYTYNTLVYADKGDYATALKYCKIVLKSMEEDYKKGV